MTSISALAASPAATLLLVAILAISAVTLLAAPGWIARGVFRPYWWLRRGEHATVLTNAFLHADLAHLAFNAFSLWAFGPGLERAIGTGAFLQLYAVGLVASDLLTWIRHRHDPGYATLGASGAILAVVFASIVVAPSQSIYLLPIPVPIPAPLFAAGYLAFSVYASRQRLGGVNHDGHLGGAIAGVAFIALTQPAVWRRALQAVGLAA